MISRIILGFLLFSFSSTSTAQYMPGLWSFHAPGNKGIVSKMLYPTERAPRPFVGAAFSTMPGLSFAGSGVLCLHHPIPGLEADLQFSAAFLNIGPYQEYSFKVLLGRQFGKALYVYLQPEYRQLAIRAYGRRGDLAYAAALAYRHGPWLFVFYGQQQVSGEFRSPFLQMAWNYTLSEHYRVALNLKKLPFSSWQSSVALDFSPDKKQSIHLALSMGPSCLLAYERQRNTWRFRLGLSYSAPLGMSPENALNYGW